MKKKSLIKKPTTKKPKDKLFKQRAFLNQAREGGMAAIQVDFSTSYSWSDSRNKWHTNNIGSIDISDCRKTINLDFYKTKTSALKKLDKMIDILTKCREFVETNYGDK